MTSTQAQAPERIPIFISCILLCIAIVLVVFVYYYARKRKQASTNKLVRCYTDWKCNNEGGSTYSPVSDFMEKLYSCRADNFSKATILEGSTQVVKPCACPIEWVGEDSKSSYPACDNTHNYNPTEQKDIADPDPSHFDTYGIKSCASYVSGGKIIDDNGDIIPTAVDAVGVNPCATLWGSRTRPPKFRWDIFASGQTQTPT